MPSVGLELSPEFKIHMLYAVLTEPSGASNKTYSWVSWAAQFVKQLPRGRGMISGSWDPAVQKTPQLPH